MELGHLGFDGILGSGNGFGLLSVDGETSTQRWATRSEGFKEEGSGFGGDAFRASKVAKIDADFSSASTALLLRNGGSLPLKSTSNAPAAKTATPMADTSTLSLDTHMSRFSSRSKPEASALPYFHHIAAAHTKNAGYLSGGLSASTDMHLLSGIRGPFTASQWLELEQQALIYKYITANEPIPAHLLIPIRKAFESAEFYGFNGGTFRLTPWRWSTFHLGYSNSTDPEPGRCRRTDGKKWRCSRDAVPNQKYCERHMNRGRHRSRKHVEGQGNGHSVSGATKSSTANLPPPSVVTTSSTPLVLPGGGSCNSFDVNHQNHYQVKNLQPSASNRNMNASVNRMLVNRENNDHGLQDATQFSFPSQGIVLSNNEGSFSISCEESGFGVHSSRPLLDAAPRKSYGLNDQGESELQHSLCAFMEEWPRNRGSADQLRNLCPRLQLQSNSSQLSMSVPTGPADFMSSTSSPTNEKAALSPLRLSQGLEMGLGVGPQSQSRRQADWTPVSWKASMGGPLGEALQSSSISNGTGESRKTSAIDLFAKGSDENGSCQPSNPSPTGVLQKSALVSLSNSSAGSSLVGDNSKTIESGGSLCTDLISSTNAAHSSSLNPWPL